MHAVEMIVIQLDEAEIKANIEESNRTVAFLKDAFAKKDIAFDKDDIDIPIITQRLALQCQICGKTFESEGEAEDSPCMDQGQPVPDSGIDSYFDINPPKGEVVHIYGYSATIEHQDLTLVEIYLPAETTGNGMESEGYYAGGDIGEAEAEEIESIARPTKREYKARSRRETKRNPQISTNQMTIQTLQALILKLRAKAHAELKAKKGRDDAKYEEYKKFIDSLKALLKDGGAEGL